jgi:molecular chaperone DnaK
LNEFGDKISGTNKETVNSALSALKHAHEQQDITGIDNLIVDLNTAWNGASEEMYKKTDSSTDSGQAKSEQPAGADDGATDVQFEEVD